MTIRAISSTHIRQECDACHRVADVDSAEIVVGLSGPGSFVFPACAACGAREFGRREGANSNPGEFDSEQNGALNMAHRLGVERGAIAANAEASVRAILAQEKGRARWADHRPRRVAEVVGAEFAPVRTVAEEFQPPLPPEVLAAMLAEDEKRAADATEQNGKNPKR